MVKHFPDQVQVGQVPILALIQLRVLQLRSFCQISRVVRSRRSQLVVPNRRNLFDIVC